MTESKTSTDLGDVIPTLWDMQKSGIIDRFAIGGAFAAILHNEPIATLDLDIFFAFKGLEEASILSLEPIYDYAREKGFVFDHEFININGWLVSISFLNILSSRPNLSCKRCSEFMPSFSLTEKVSESSSLINR